MRYLIVAALALAAAGCTVTASFYVEDHPTPTETVRGSVEFKYTPPKEARR